MNVNELIDKINRTLNKNLDVYSTSSNINQIDAQLKQQLRDYKKAIEILQSDLIKYTKSNRLKSIDINYRAFTACAIGAKHKNIGAFGTSSGYIVNYGSFTYLLNRLKYLGRIGERSKSGFIKGRRNFVGKCAEIKASYALHKAGKITDLKKIEFTNAYRPRTLQIMERCNNCKFIFGNI
jgi:hypothetical protein